MHNDKKISRRVVLRGAVLAAGTVPVLLSGMTAAHAKVKQEQVHYQLQPKDGQHCSICATPSHTRKRPTEKPRGRWFL